jgi:hypothetical protein
MELSPSSQAASYSVTQEFTTILRNLTVHCRVYKSSPEVPILSQVNTVHTTPFHLSKNRFNIVPCWRYLLGI